VLICCERKILLAGGQPAEQAHISPGGKLILIESCLSSIPVYTMGVYLLYEGNYQQLRLLRLRFFWQDTKKEEVPYDQMGGVEKRFSMSCLCSNVCEYILHSSPNKSF
jgi:hypothetical protein